MIKKLLIGGVALVAIGSLLSSQKWVQSAAFRVESALERHERQDLLENWSSHYDRELARMTDQHKKLRRKTHEQTISARKTQIELDSLRTRATEYDQLIRSFVEKAKAPENASNTFSFCGRVYNAQQARAQMKRYAVEMSVVQERIEHLTRLHQARLQVVTSYRSTAKQLAKRLKDLQIQREHYSVKMGLAQVRSELRTTQDLLRDFDKISIEEESSIAKIVQVLEDNLSEEQARDSIENSPASRSATHSLSESLHQQNRSQPDNDRTQTLLQHYWNQDESPTSH